jgi:hypothetical protein
VTLRVIEKGRLHRALRQGFSALDGYTSDADGIRHAMLQEPNLSAADAEFFLLSRVVYEQFEGANVDRLTGGCTRQPGELWRLRVSRRR